MTPLVTSEASLHTNRRPAKDRCLFAFETMRRLRAGTSEQIIWLECLLLNEEADD